MYAVYAASSVEVGVLMCRLDISPRLRKRWRMARYRHDALCHRARGLRNITPWVTNTRYNSPVTSQGFPGRPVALDVQQINISLASTAYLCTISLSPQSP